MRLTHNMSSIAEYSPVESSVPNRVIKMAVIGGSGVGKTGKKKDKKETTTLYFTYSSISK